MATERYRWDSERGELVPLEQWRSPGKRQAADMMPDIAPYQSMITGEWITSRSQHREHLRRHEHEEVGSSMPKFLREHYERKGERPRFGRDGRRIG